MLFGPLQCTHDILRVSEGGSASSFAFCIPGIRTAESEELMALWRDPPLRRPVQVKGLPGGLSFVLTAAGVSLSLPGHVAKDTQ